VDFVDPAFAPGTGTPEVGGFTSREAQEFLRGLAGLKIIGADVVEVYPAYDPAEVTALLAANAAYELLSLVANFAAGNSDPQ
jgi:agmatinase